jgi:hypothetical protein
MFPGDASSYYINFLVSSKPRLLSKNFHLNSSAINNDKSSQNQNLQPFKKAIDPSKASRALNYCLSIACHDLLLPAIFSITDSYEFHIQRQLNLQHCLRKSTIVTYLTIVKTTYPMTF